MGKLADALNFEKAFTVEGVDFTVRRLCVADILRCAIDGIQETESIGIDKAYERAEELISGETIIFPKAGIARVMAAASDDLDITDATALVTLNERAATDVCRFALGLPTAKPDDGTIVNTKPKKKSRLTGLGLIRSFAFILARR